MNIWWENPTKSGLGDRLLDVSLLAALARVVGGNLYLEWPEWKQKDCDCPHRAEDVKLENVLKFLSFPKEAKFSAPPAGSHRFSTYLGGGVPDTSFFSAFVLAVAPKTTAGEFWSALNWVYSEFQFCPQIQCYLRSLPKEFTSFHVRRGDKVRADRADWFVLEKSKEGLLDACTERALAVELSRSDYFFICGDDQSADRFKSQVKESGKQLIELPAMPKWQSTYYDMAVMSRSSLVVVAHRYSSFSRMSSLMGGAPFKSIFKYPGVNPDDI